MIDVHQYQINIKLYAQRKFAPTNYIHTFEPDSCLILFCSGFSFLMDRFRFSGFSSFDILFYFPCKKTVLFFYFFFHLRVQLHARNIEPDRNRKTYKTNIFSEMEKKSVWGNMTYACFKNLKRSQVEMPCSHLHKNIIILYDTHVFYDHTIYIFTEYKIATL